MIIISFNPRSRTGNDYPFMFPRSRIVVSIHVPARGTTSWDKMHSSFLLFQSTFPHGERRDMSILANFNKSSFNPRSRTGNDDEFTYPKRVGLVSIHVPARGTTIFDEGFKEVVFVSIHVPARGTTICLIIYRDFHIRFQSTFPHGERR